MDLKCTLTVEEVLRRPLFQDALVVAGDKGLNRSVRWVHILETSNFDLLIHGEEMILTTGIAFQSNLSSFVSYIEKLVHQNASCLCIELGTHFNSVPEEMIEAANRYRFPLIIFPHTVRFVDITQDLHSLIINKHHEILKDLERISREFHRLTLSSNGVTNVLKLLHSSTLAQVIYLPVKKQAQFVPALPAHEQKKMMKFISDRLEEIPENHPNAETYQWKYENNTMIVQPAGALGKPWAYVVMVLDQEPEQYDYLILDSATLSISQDLLRNRYIEERKLYTENLWIDDLIHLRIKDEEEIKSLVGSGFKKLNEASYRVCLIEFYRSDEHRWNEAKEGADSVGIHLSMVIRSIFEQHSFLPLITLKKNGLVVVAIDLNTKRSSKTGLSKVFQTLQQLSKDEQNEHFRLLIGIGGSYVKLHNAYLSYREAMNALELYPCFEDNVLFFEDLGVFQLLFNLGDKKVLQSFVDSYLGPLIEHDQSKGSELLRTLKVYLDHDGSKQIAAQKLFIVRQSLYYRLEKIMELLGADFMNPEIRLALQVALRAYQILNPDKLTNRE
ncbi:PucR family transcriptional regulator [Paenibacillus sp. EPM92]|uniref:PucR family transcriptional regulator n=1 Tax=Paenibacillus sp. EPM92 TaxID=1561195 RepID=UPI001915FBCA|nr:PucR family transcriptional regulator [Paenibacillus sp. EPM92]